MLRFSSLCGVLFVLALVSTSAVGEALPPHPRLLLPDAEMAAVKQRLADHDWARAVLESLRAKYDKTLDAPITLPDRGGQWWHYYACPTHGARLKTESPTRHVCPVDGEVFTGYPYDDCYIMLVHLDLAASVRDLGILYRVTGEEKYATRCREILLAYAEKYLSYAYHDIHGKPQVPGGRVTPQTLDEAVWLIRLAKGVDLIWDRLTPEQIETLKTKLFYPCVKDVILPHRMGIHNIQCWKNSAVGMTGLLFDDPELVANAVDSDQGLLAQFAKGVSPDGQWGEGAWGYHFYALNAMLPLVEALHVCGKDFYNDTVHRMFAAPVLLAMPDGKLPAFNDSDASSAAGNPDYELGLARFGDPLLAEPLRGRARESVQAMLYGVDPLPEVPEESAGSQNFPSSGYAILRSASTWLCMKYGPHGGGHGHYDKLSFVLYANGKILANDPGNSPYGLPIHKGWHKTTLAHNTISIDQQNQSPATGSSLGFVTGKDYSAVLLDAGAVYPNAMIRRGAFVLGDSLVVFIDQVTTTDGKKHAIDDVYHPAGKWAEVGQLPFPTTIPTKDDPTRSPAYDYLSKLLDTTTTESHTVGVASPVGGTTVTFAGSDSPTTYLVGTGLAKTTADRVPIVIARRTASAATFAWAVTTRAGGSAPKLMLESPTTVRVEYEGKAWVLRADGSAEGDERIQVREVTAK